MSVLTSCFWTLFNMWWVGGLLNHGVSWLRRNEIKAETAACVEEINAFSHQVDKALESENWGEVLDTLRKMKGTHVLPYNLKTALYYAATSGNLPAVMNLVERFPIQSCAYLQMALMQAQNSDHDDVASFLQDRCDTILML